MSEGQEVLWDWRYQSPQEPTAIEALSREGHAPVFLGKEEKRERKFFAVLQERSRKKLLSKLYVLFCFGLGEAYNTPDLEQEKSLTSLIFLGLNIIKERSKLD